jgi:hypothetical protein
VDTVLSILMLAALALLAGAFWFWRRQGFVRQVWLMIVLAFVILANVAIWTIPDKDGATPASRAAGPLK